MKQTQTKKGCPFHVHEDRPADFCSDGLALPETEVSAQAFRFLNEVYDETAFRQRWRKVQQEIRDTGSYRHTEQESHEAAKLAWRNSSRCIGRLYWPSLKVIDARDAKTEDEVFEAICHHLRTATNGGKLKAYLTLFPQVEAGSQAPFRVLNDQIIRYACFANGQEIIGDPQQAALTQYAASRGWTAPESPFAVLPLFIQKGSHKPRMYLLPQDDLLEVPIRHPDVRQLDRLKLRWHALPMISNMALHAGGLVYPCAPFNGWYMGAEIGARNLADPHRYNLLPKIADLLGWDTRRNRSLWRDRAMLILNEAVLWSFEQAGVKIQDHHTCSEDFQRFVAKEAQAGRDVSGDWRWLVPPISGSASPLFHQDFQHQQVDPNFYYMPKIDFDNFD